jgi:hypothetical protein
VCILEKGNQNGVGVVVGKLQSGNLDAPSLRHDKGPDVGFLDALTKALGQ